MTGEQFPEIRNAANKVVADAIKQGGGEEAGWQAAETEAHKIHAQKLREETIA